MFTKAIKAQQKLRAALFGPSGAGKTFTALSIAAGIGGSCAVIDSERGSASKYADRFQFDTCNLEDRTISGYMAAMKAAAEVGYNVLVIDSLSHAWQELLDDVDKVAASNRFGGNRWSAWSVGTPKQKVFIDAILTFPGHVIATMRSKTEWTTEKDSRGKDKPVRVGLVPEQGKGIEYEFDFLFQLSTDHVLDVIKDRSGRFQDRIIERPGTELGRELEGWLSDGVPPGVALFPDALRAQVEGALTPVGVSAMICQMTQGTGESLDDIPETLRRHIPTVLANPEAVARWNRGRNHRTGEPLPLNHPAPSAQAAQPVPVWNGAEDGPLNDDDDPPVHWAAGEP